MTIKEYDTYFALEYKKGYLNKNTDHPKYVWDLGDSKQYVESFLKDLIHDYPKSEFMLVRHCNIEGLDLK